MDWASPLLRAETLPFVVGIAGILMCVVAIIVGGLVRIAKMLIVHRERMAKIAHGIDPDWNRQLSSRGVADIARE